MCSKVHRILFQNTVILSDNVLLNETLLSVMMKHFLSKLQKCSETVVLVTAVYMHVVTALVDRQAWSTSKVTSALRKGYPSNTTTETCMHCTSVKGLE